MFIHIYQFQGQNADTLKTTLNLSNTVMIHFILLFSRQGKLRLQKWYTTLPDKERKKITREIVQIVLSRGQRTSSFVDWKELKLVYKRYASLYFCCAVENQDNELLTLEVVHRYVELLDKYFGNDPSCWFLLMRLPSVSDSCLRLPGTLRFLSFCYCYS
ncbi:AP-1 complex subunit sigma-3 isoform X2 [Leopardus geoffroyi]|uniref:AP-1 complex subunit sigma-3 isoform X2 n=1 Tax=Leopardus geoffroyi TaxID=46844 RepID=UPI001E264289|nr:AP-1 complex subunit sigma-3 isoform X2 [Leopardus geoffroyi]